MTETINAATELENTLNDFSESLLAIAEGYQPDVVIPVSKVIDHCELCIKLKVLLEMEQAAKHARLLNGSK